MRCFLHLQHHVEQPVPAWAKVQHKYDGWFEDEAYRFKVGDLVHGERDVFKVTSVDPSLPITNRAYRINRVRPIGVDDWTDCRLCRKWFQTRAREIEIEQIMKT